MKKSSESKENSRDFSGLPESFDLFSKGCSFTDDSVMTIAVGKALLAVGPEATVKEIEEAVVTRCRIGGRDIHMQVMVEDSGIGLEKKILSHTECSITRRRY